MPSAARILLFADVHLDKPFSGMDPDAARARRQNVREALKRIIRLADEERVDAVCCAGDLYEQDYWSPDTKRFLEGLFGQISPVPVLLAPGNHDYYGPKSLYHQARWSPNVHVFSSGRFEPFELAPGFMIWGVAHLKPKGTPCLLDDFRVDGAGLNVALFHGSEVTGMPLQGEGKDSHAPFRAEQVRQAGFYFALLGHYHRPVEGEYYAYPGNPDPLEFGEEGERGPLIAEIGEEGVRLDRRRVSVSEVSDLEVDLSDAAHGDEVLALVRQATSGLEGFVRLNLKGMLAPEVELPLLDREVVAPHLEHLVVRASGLGVAEDFERLAGEQTVRGAFVRRVREAEGLDEQDRRRVLVAGLRALAGRRDLEVL